MVSGNDRRRRRLLRRALENNANDDLKAISFSSVTQQKTLDQSEKYLSLGKGQTSKLVRCRRSIRPRQLPKSQ
jgi:hypothetical protein